MPWAVACGLLYPWNSSGKNTGVGCHSFLQEILPTQWFNPGLLHCRQFPYYQSHYGSDLISISVQFSGSVVSDSLWPYGLQHARFPCQSPTLEACSNSCPSVSDTIQPSHPLSSPPSPAFNLSQRQGLFQWVGSSHQVAKVLELQHHSFQWVFRIDFL